MKKLYKQVGNIQQLERSTDGKLLLDLRGAVRVTLVIVMKYAADVIIDGVPFGAAASDPNEQQRYVVTLGNYEYELDYFLDFAGTNFSTPPSVTPVNVSWIIEKFSR